MSAPLQYETPENVRVEYRSAGLGTRFIAWLLDGIILYALMFFLFIVLMVVAVAYESVLKEYIGKLGEMPDPKNPEEIQRFSMYVVGIGMLIWGFGSFFYYCLSELLLHGQTIGKRVLKIRVAKANGFALDGVGIFVRNIFRLADQLPPLWIVPFISSRRQRFGDMVAGTIVISDETESLTEIREELSGRNPAESRFRFDNARLQNLPPTDFEAIERILDRWASLPGMQRKNFLNTMLGPLCRRLKVEEPALEDRITFLEDLLAAEFRRQDRHLR